MFITGLLTSLLTLCGSWKLAPRVVARIRHCSRLFGVGRALEIVGRSQRHRGFGPFLVGSEFRCDCICSPQSGLTTAVLSWKCCTLLLTLVGGGGCAGCDGGRHLRGGDDEERWWAFRALFGRKVQREAGVAKGRPSGCCERRKTCRRRQVQIGRGRSFLRFNVKELCSPRETHLSSLRFHGSRMESWQ